MFCSNCGKEVKRLKKIQEDKIVSKTQQQLDSNKQIMMAYQCPTCGKIIHENLNEAELKSLNQVAHSRVHKARYNINSGLCSIVIGLILAVIGFLFLALSFDLQNNKQLDPTRVEFYVCCTLLGVATVLLTFGIITLVFGLKNKKTYQELINNIQHQTFVQK